LWYSFEDMITKYLCLAVIKDRSAFSADFTISDPPSSSDNDRLIQDIILQAESLPKKADPYGRSYSISIETELAFKPVKKVATYNNFLSVFRADNSDQSSFDAVSNILHFLLKISIEAGEQEGWPITVVLMPSSSTHTKRSARPYGTYELPTTLESRQQNTEALLSPSSSQPSRAPQSPNVSDLEDFPTILQASDDSPVLGILPSCFATEDACFKKTHNCSSHGVCQQTRKGESGKDAKIKDCWSCQCTPTKQHVGADHGMESRVKTTYWGGPACQKKDISMPFWLFVATGVTLAVLISGGIGLLYSVGSEELPSVIGAGVSGPSRK
jgi:hypothetical protein